MHPAFWRDKTVFLTGHTGFKGAWLSLWLQQMGAKVVGYALPPPTNPALFDVARVGAGMQSIVGDIRDLAILTQALHRAAPDVVIHMAAQSLVRLSYEAPVETYATNVMGTVHLLEAVRGCASVRAVLCITSDKCYENKEWVWGYRENEPMGGYDPYSNSKGCSELVAAAYRSSFFNSADYARHRVGVATCRAGNVIGGGDWARDRLVPDLMQGFIDRTQPVIRNPLAVRPWQHVLEPLSGYLCLAERLFEHGDTVAEGWNFGPDEANTQPVHVLADKLAQGWGDNAAWALDQGAHPHEARSLRLDCTKARVQLRWRPVWSLDITLSNILAWYRAFVAGGDMREICLQQIESYQSLAVQDER